MTGILLIDCWEPPVWKPWVHQLYHNIIAVIKQHQPIVVVDASYGDATKSQALAPYITTSILELDALLALDIPEWICMGRDWQECVHHRPVGLIALSRTTLQIHSVIGTITKTTGDFVTDQDYEHDHLNWQAINSLSWKLETQSI